MLKNLTNLFFPKLCANCNTLLLRNENVICIACLQDLPFTNYHLTTKNKVTDKFYGLLPVEFASAMLYFTQDGVAQRLIHKLKYKNKQEIGSYLGVLYANDLIKVNTLKEITSIIPVPLHNKKLKERGYNQIENFAKAISKELNIVYNDKLLYRTRYSKTQTIKNKENRSINTKALFDINTNTLVEQHPHFLLVDDVITTGATLESCVKALLKIDNAKVSIVTIAFTL